MTPPVPLLALCAVLLCAVACTPVDWAEVRSTAEAARDDVADVSAAVSALAPGIVAACPTPPPDALRDACRAVDVAWQAVRTAIIVANRTVEAYDATGQTVEAALKAVDAADDALEALRRAVEAVQALAEPVAP